MSTTTMLPPWALTTFPQYMRYELRRRSGYKNTDKKIDGHYNFNYESGYSKNYKGPMTTWIQVASNAVVGGKLDDNNELIKNVGKHGFIFLNSSNFDNAYGFNNGRNQIIGYTFDNEPHIIPTSIDYTIGTIQPHRAVPSITSIDLEIKKSIYRQMTINWKCYSLDQLNYVGEYMFSPYITLIVEWGWNNFNPNSLLDFRNLGISAEYKKDEKGNDTYELKEGCNGSGLRGAYTNPKIIEDNIEKSNGNYDAMIGHIINFEYSYNTSNNSFDCKTTIAGNSKYYFSLAIENLTLTNEENKKAKKQESFKSYFSKTLPKKINESIKNPNTQLNTIRNEKGVVVKSHGRVFNSKLHRIENLEKSKFDKTYITFGLFVELLNSFIEVGTNDAKKTNVIGIKISGTRIGAHPNMISPNIDFLIPNSRCPFINSLYLSSPKDKAIVGDIDKSKAEIPFNADDTQSKKIVIRENLNDVDNVDLILYNIMNQYGDVYRQDLDQHINKYRKKVSGETMTAFPATTTKKEDKLPIEGNQIGYWGYLEDIYISLDLIKSAVENQKELVDVLKHICGELNKDMPVWQLEPIAGESNVINIVDAKFVDLAVLRNSAKLNNDEPVIYFFDTFSQNSIVTGYEFNVKLSDAAATMIINQVNSELSDKKESKQITNTSPLTKISRPIDQLTVGRPLPKVEIKKEDVIEAKDFMKNYNRKNINTDSLYFERQNKDRKIEMVRFCLPKNCKDLLQNLLNDNSDYFVNIASMPIPGTSVNITLPGIAGLKTFQVFGVYNLPKPYDKDIVFKILDVKHSITAGEGWVTTINSMILPMKNSVMPK